MKTISIGGLLALVMLFSSTNDADALGKGRLGKLLHRVVHTATLPVRAVRHVLHRSRGVDQADEGNVEQLEVRTQPRVCN